MNCGWAVISRFNLLKSKPGDNGIVQDNNISDDDDCLEPSCLGFRWWCSLTTMNDDGDRWPRWPFVLVPGSLLWDRSYEKYASYVLANNSNRKRIHWDQLCFAYFGSSCRKDLTEQGEYVPSVSFSPAPDGQQRQNSSSAGPCTSCLLGYIAPYGVWSTKRLIIFENPPRGQTTQPAQPSPAHGASF